MQTGLLPASISALVCQNYSPLLWGGMHLLEGIIARPDLKIITDRATGRFFEHGIGAAVVVSLEDIESRFVFPSGRVLEFIKVPFAHSAGSFVTFDRKSKVLFSGDLFSAYVEKWKLPLELDPRCLDCTDFSNCPNGVDPCPLPGILDFHREIMSSERALRAAVDRIAQLTFDLIAPYHGSVIHNSKHIVRVCELLSRLKGVGIDATLGDRCFVELGDVAPIRNRLLASGV
jgi:hypothetical protein